MEGSIYHVADLGESARSAVEGLVGHPLGNDELIYVASLGVQAEATPAERREAWDEVAAIIGEMQQNVAHSRLSPEQIDTLIDAECEAARYDRRT
jgi:hypothetical protein